MAIAPRRSFDELDSGATRAGEALGMVESAGIAEGYAAADRALKAAAVELLLCAPASPGKLLVIFAGAPSAVAAALRAALDGLAQPLDTLLLPKVEPRVIAALAGAPSRRPIDAAVVVESASVATLFTIADVALKTAAVDLAQLRAANQLGGKAFCVLFGEISQVRAAAEAASGFAATLARAVQTTLLTQPHAELQRWLRGEAAS